MKKHISFLLFFLTPLLIYCQTIEAIDSTSQIILKPRIYVLSNLQNSSVNNTTYILGLSISAKISNKLTISSSFDQLSGTNNKIINEYIDSLNVFPRFGTDNRNFKLNISSKLNEYIKIDFGKSRHFVGDGYRSILLSSEHDSYPFLKLSTEFGRFKYYNLYTTFTNLNSQDIGRKKHAAIHYLDFEICDNIHLGLFESILWQAKTENFYRGYDFAYLNPIIFYRPVEFSQQSNKGNALMGANLKLNYKNTLIYAQFLLDDLNIARQKDQDENYQSGFFQNKFAYQIGIKNKFKKINSLVEYNQVQPYTYGHRTILQNYSHMNQSLAHPLGANFKELVIKSDYNLNKWAFSFSVTTAKIGFDSLNTHYGQNIFASDSDASTGGQNSYGNFNGQGVITSFNTIFGEISYSFKTFSFFGSMYFRNKNSSLINERNIFYSVGIRNFSFSTFRDY